MMQTHLSTYHHRNGGWFPLLLRWCMWVSLWGMTSHVMAQHQGDLSREELLARIDLSQRLLDETRDREAESLTALRILNQQIDLRQALLQRLTEEVYQQAAAVEKAELLGCEMEEDIAQIRRNYLLAAQATYHQLGTDNFWLAVLSAGGLSDAFYRMQYFRRFVSYRDEQMDLLEATRKELAEQRQRLAEALAESQARLDLRSDQLTALERDRARQRVLYQALKQQAQRFREQLVEERLRLQRLIQESEQLYAHSVQPVAEGYGLTFPQQKGRLTWPVPPTQSVVIARFGQTEDPYGNLVANDGIYLRTPEGQQVSAVYAGRVTAVTEIPMNGGALVIVEHGKYRSVYANLEKAFVQKDQLIAAGQTLGLVRTDRRTGETVLHFLIYTLPNRFVNPEQWLR